MPGSNTLVSYSLNELQTVLDKLASSETERVAKEDVEQIQVGMHGFEGISAMISDLKRRMNFGDPTAGTIDLQGKPKQAVKIIEGRWNNDALELIALTKKTDDANQQDRRYLWNEKMTFFMRAPMSQTLLRCRHWTIGQIGTYRDYRKARTG